MIKDSLNFTVLILLVIFSVSFGQSISLRGRVTDEDNQAIQGAQVKLVTADKSQTTNREGSFFIDVTSAYILPAEPVLNIISYYNGILSFNVSEIQQKVHIEVFDFKGQKVKNVIQEGVGKGAYSIKILQDNLPIAMYFMRLQIGNKSSVFKILNLKNRTYSGPDKRLYSEKSSLKRSADVMEALDKLEVSKDGYETAQVEVHSYITELPDIVLKSDGSNDEGLPPVVNGMRAKTTRYWDCCKPHCGWHSNMRMCDINNNEQFDQGAQSGCNGGSSFQCWDYAPIEINSKVSYGWAAFNNSGTQCGECFQLDFEGALSGKQMIVQVINIGDGGNDAFDLLIPGGGVGALNGCSRQWNNAPLGQQYGGFHSTCGDNEGCIRGMCQEAFGDKADLMRGCEWYLGWFKMTSNPQVNYMKVSCPQEIKNISQIGN